MADYLSRLKSGEEGTGIKDDFPDAQLFWVQAVNAQELNEETEDTWISDMTIFLTTRIPPKHLSVDERKRLAMRSRNFCILNDTLYLKAAYGIWRRVVRQFKKAVIL